jgi:hypothetical protein
MMGRCFTTAARRSWPRTAPVSTRSCPRRWPRGRGRERGGRWDERPALEVPRAGDRQRVRGAGRGGAPPGARAGRCASSSATIGRGAGPGPSSRTATPSTPGPP